jgi:hypothetical protein
MLENTEFFIALLLLAQAVMKGAGYIKPSHVRGLIVSFSNLNATRQTV